MPKTPPHPCANRPCPRLTHERHCGECARELGRVYNAERRRRPETNDAFYSSKAWRALRALVLAEEPLCVDCSSAGLTVAATEVDHVTPIRDGGEALDRTNLAPRCKPCHSRKSALEGSRWRRRTA